MSLKKRLKRLGRSAKKTVKVVTRGAAKIVKYAAPVAGAIVGGPLGAAAGSALGAAAGQVGPTKNRRKALMRSLKFGAAVTGGTAVLGLASGAGIGSSVLGSVSKIFGGGEAPAPTSDQPGEQDFDFGFGGPAKPGQGPQGGKIFDFDFNPFGRTPGDPGSDPSPDDPRQTGGGGGFFENFLGGGGDAPGFFETEEGKPDLLKIGLAVGAAWFLFFRKKAG